MLAKVRDVVSRGRKPRLTYRALREDGARKVRDALVDTKAELGPLPRQRPRRRRTAHTHSPVADARGNAEALARFKEFGLNIQPLSND